MRHCCSLLPAAMAGVDVWQEPDAPIRLRCAAHALQAATDGYGGGFQGHLRGLQWEFAVIDSPQVNAFVVPGGKVVVYTGKQGGDEGVWDPSHSQPQATASPTSPLPAHLPPMHPTTTMPHSLTHAGLLGLVRSEDELASVLAHECAHVVARHGAERLTQQGLTEAARLLAYWWVCAPPLCVWGGGGVAGVTGAGDERGQRLIQPCQALLSCTPFIASCSSSSAAPARRRGAHTARPRPPRPLA